MISEHELVWKVEEPSSIEEVSFRYSIETIEGKRENIVSSVRNNSSEWRKLKMVLLNEDTGTELNSIERVVEPFATIDLVISFNVDSTVNYQAKVEEV